MTNEKLRRLHLIYGIALSVIIIITGICFIVSCIDIYRSGARPFTYESINSHFMAIVVPVVLCIVGIIGGMVLSFFPLEKPKIKGIIDTGTTLKKMSAKIDLSKCDAEAQSKIAKERKIRLYSNVFCIDAIAVSLVISLIYMLNKNNFPANDINGEMVSAMLFVIPCAIVSLAAIYATMLICTSSYARELEVVKQALRSGQQSAASGQQANKPTTAAGGPSPLTVKGGYVSGQNEKILLGARLTIFVLAVAFIVIGIFNGGMADVLQKAINICTECIGLG